MGHKTLVLVYNFPHQIMGIRANQLFHNNEPIVCRASNNIVDTIRFVQASLRYWPKTIYAIDIGIPSFIASLILKILTFGKVKVIIDTGDLVYLFSKAEKKYNPFVLLMIRITEDFFIGLADRIIIRAPYHAVYLKEKYGKNDVEYLTDGVDLQRFKPVNAFLLRKKLGLEGKFVIGVMGNLFWIEEWEWCYGYYEVAALSLLKNNNIHMLVVGDGRGLDKLKERAKKLGVETQIIFTGRVPHDEVNLYLNAMDVFMFTQPHHLQTKIRTCAKLPELLAANCFVISTDLKEPMHFLDKIGLIVPFKGLKDASYPKRLAVAIRKLYKNRSILQNRRGGRDRAKRFFSYSVLRERLNAALRKPFK